MFSSRVFGKAIPITSLYTIHYLKNASLSLLTLVLKSKQKDKNFFAEVTEDAVGAVLILCVQLPCRA